ncbi:hypothetical protein [Companilactobacillus sp.]|uniref:hypothetical protein n=1 Tax=Companilactobacillus sp. TaxID=2767905 RepID=UPI002635A50A|nr:hypothetical protein [Companilactobacillus sp.]
MPGSKPRQIPADFKVFALANNSATSMARYEVGYDTFRKWCKQLGIADEIAARGMRPPRPCPADFAGNAHRSNAELHQIYPDTPAKHFTRWRKEVGIASATQLGGSVGEPVPDDFPALVRQNNITRLCLIYRVSDSVIKRWCRITGLSPKRYDGSIAKPHGPKRAPDIDHRPVDAAGQAQRHLQRIGPVYRRNEDMYCVFGRVMPAKDMIAFAEKKGWDAKAWERI